MFGGIGCEREGKMLVKIVFMCLKARRGAGINYSVLGIKYSKKNLEIHQIAY
jgi:hypothetical protein